MASLDNSQDTGDIQFFRDNFDPSSMPSFPDDEAFEEDSDLDEEPIAVKGLYAVISMIALVITR